MKGLETRRGADPDQGSAGFFTGSNIMILIGGDVKGFPLFGFERPVAQMNDDASGQNITEFFSLMGKIRVRGAAGSQRQADWFHAVFLGIGNDPFNFIF